MQQNSETMDKVNFLIGSADIAAKLSDVNALIPFSDVIMEFLNEVSKLLMKDVRSKSFSDVVTFAFWIRKGSVMKLKERFENQGSVRLGKGVVFHIAPSNVPVNFAYTLVSGLLCGNVNVVRVPSKEFPQVDIIIDAFRKAICEYPQMENYILCVRYDHLKEVNDLFSAVADMRVIWGGDQTIAELRKSPLPPRSGEITFADRYSLALIDSDSYCDIDDKERVATDFYNDTFFSDQNACTSPRIIIWTGNKVEEAKKVFWEYEHELVMKKYEYQSIQGVNKLTKSYLIAAVDERVKVEQHADNLIIRVNVSEITDHLMDFCDNSGYFYEYDCKEAKMLLPILNDKRCQTVSYIGNHDILLPLLKQGIKGVDRIVPMGKTMDFDLIWDGYDLPAVLTRTVMIK